MTQIRGRIGEIRDGNAPIIALSTEQVAANNVLARAHYAELNPGFFANQGVQLTLPAAEVPQA